MNGPKLRLLLLSVGSLTGHHVIDGLGARRERCILIGTNSVEEASGNFRCDTAYLVPSAASGAAYIERIAELIREERPDLVIPCRDDDVLALAIVGEHSPPSHSVLLTGTVAAARIMDDKVETARFAGRHELPFAPTAENAEEAFEFAKKYRLPLIGKPRAGNGSRGVVILRSKEEIARAFAARSDLIAQPFLDPPSNMDSLIAPFEEGLPFFFSFPETRQYTVRVPVGPDGTISPPFGCWTTLVMGRSSRYSRCEEPDLLEISRAYAVAAAEEGWRGPLNLQFKRTAEGDLMGHELNGRFGGGIAARAKLGFDEIAEVFNRFLPGMPFPALAESLSDVAEQYPCAHAVLREGVAALRKSGKWARAGNRSS